MIKVSVVVPIYNAEQYLDQCLQSIVNQTLQEIEIILVNDGSTDGSSAVCERYLGDPRVTYFYKENEGLAAARRDGIAKAQGEYIGFVDSDDWIEPDMYEKMYAAAKTNCADIVFCNCVENQDGHKFTPEMPSGAYDREGIKSVILPRSLAYISKQGGKRSIRWSNCLRIYRRAHLEANNIVFDGRFRRSQDLQMTYEATLCAQNYYYLGEDHFYHNRVVGNSLSRGYTKNMWPLYRPLIERLYRDTEDFKEMDLMDQMHLRAFFFATDCIENEMKSLCPNDKKTRIRLIREVMEDELCQRFYGHIPTEQLNPLYRTYYHLMYEKKPEKLLSYTASYGKKQKRQEKIWKPLKHFVTEGPVIGALYKAIRK